MEILTMVIEMKHVNLDIKSHFSPVAVVVVDIDVDVTMYLVQMVIASLLMVDLLMLVTQKMMSMMTE